MAARRWQFWLGFSFFISVVMGSIATAVWLYYVAMDANQVPLKRLVVQGELQYVSAAEVREQLQQRPLGSFFSAEVDEIRAQLEAMPWVYSVSVRKEWPDLLKVYLREQRPLAHWNAQQRPQAMVNEQGLVFEADKSRLQQPLPYLAGPEHAVAETVKSYRQVLELLELNGFALSSLQLSDRFAVTVVLESGIELKLGREGLLERVQRFIDLYPEIRDYKDTAVEYIDLRYDTGVAVSWRQPQT
ncbi:cell division protein FtsQ/DivIB [Pseudidiomarina taiwanensis]|nr:cell division protein FtsQ/DivIB [Pseudidiomarina taiwanensis]